MRNFLHSTAQKLITSTVAFRYALDNLLYRQPQRTKEAFARLRNSATGKPIMVIGNGPSLNRTPLGEFKHIPSVGMNKIDLLYPYTCWRPTVVVCTNNLVVRQNRAVFADNDIPTFLAWKSRWFKDRSGSDCAHYFKNQATLDFSTDVSRWVASLSPTVTYTALQFAYYMGGNPVLLFGIDHEFNTDTAETGIRRRLSADDNHFDPNYFKPGQLWGLPDLKGSEAAYRLAQRAFEKDGRQIYDATIDGKLEVFEKIPLTQARDILLDSSAHGTGKHKQ